jgi:hypothetical protein
MAFADLSEFFDDRLHLPINGVVYDIPSPDHELGLWVTALVSAGLSIEQGIDPALAGNRSIPQLRFEGDEYDDGSDEAKLYQRIAPNRAARRRATESTPTGGASTTGAPGSTKGIRSRSTSRKP